MPFGKDKNISQGKEDGRKKNPGAKAGIGGKVGHGKQTRFSSENNPKKKVDGRKNNNPASLRIGEETRFKPGHEPRNKLLRTMLKERGFSREVINDIFAQILTCNPDDITKMKLDKEISMLELIGISGIEAAMRTADFGRMDYLLGQIFGKQVQRTENINYNYNAGSENSDSDAERTKKFIEQKAKSWEQH